jgi:hypothetical protein
MSEELWIAHYSIQPWLEPNRWNEYFKQVENTLGVKLTHLDVNDPVKRKVRSIEEASEFICAFRPREDSRWLFGKCEGGICFSIQHYRQLKHFPNTLKWYIPITFLQQSESPHALKMLFNLGNQFSNPFYAYGDDLSKILVKRKKSGSVNIQAELLGVFWMTYFNSAYVSYFGRDRLESLPGVEFGANGGATVVLGKTPSDVSLELRNQLVAVLGEQSFVNPNDILGKLPGRYALTFAQLVEAANK